MAVPKAAAVLPKAAPVTSSSFPSVSAPSASAVKPSVQGSSIEEEIFGSDDLLNKKIGNYNIVWKIGEDEWGPVYVAVQTSMARPVAMKVLADSVLHADPTAKERFLATARAKAAVKHPAIISVYEAGEASGHIYYTYEYVDGAHLAQMQEEGQTITDALALRIAKTTAEGLSYLQHQKIPHAPVAARRIYIGKDNLPHLANPARLAGEEPHEVQSDVIELARVITSLLVNGTATDPGLRSLLAKMQTEGSEGILSWGALLQALKALEPKVIPVDVVKLTAQDQAAIRAVEETKRQQKRVLIITAASVCSCLLLLVFMVWRNFFHSNERNLNAMVHIPAGQFIYQNGDRATTGEFWIDQYEVTIGQYARFLDFLKENPTTEFDHPDQPKAKSHVPKSDADWKIYYGRARAGLPARFVPIDMNCPIFNVDWWDAYAYAKWAKKRLPTEQEWEKAARGPNGFTYPWGNQFDPHRVNSGLDYDESPNPKSKGAVDGYFWWAPVDKLKGDISGYQVMGMGGNMAEWTDSWDEKHKFPVIRGGSFHSKDAEKQTMTTSRFTTADPERIFEFLGFRCVSDQPPQK